MPWLFETAGRISGTTGATAQLEAWTFLSDNGMCVKREAGTGGCEMSAAVCYLPFVHAYAADEVSTRKQIAPELAFYRKYTEGILRRYVRLSMEAGRVPSLLGQEMFRGRVTSYKVRGFDDVVIFVHDVQRCLTRLTTFQQEILERIAMQEYTQGETAVLMGLGLRTVVRRYADALDVLTGILLEVRILEPLTECQ